MENKDVLEFLEEDANGTNVSQLFHFGLQSENHDLYSLLENLTIDDFRDMMGDKCDFKSLQEYIDNGETYQYFIDNDMWGFFAEIHIPKHRDFYFYPDGEFSSCYSNSSVCTVTYVYAETMDELLSKIKIEAEKQFKIEMNRSKKIQKEKEELAPVVTD